MGTTHILKEVDNESPDFIDITGDGMPELVCDNGGHIGYAEMPKDDPTKTVDISPITPKRKYERFTHGMGTGDVNGDGRIDICRRKAGGSSRGRSKAEYSLDVPPGEVHRAGRRADVRLRRRWRWRQRRCHQQGCPSVRPRLVRKHWQGGRRIKFKEHLFMGEKPEQNEFGVAFSQLHAVALADMDHDGIPDIITGKRFSHCEQ